MMIENVDEFEVSLDIWLSKKSVQALERSVHITSKMSTYQLF